MAGRTGTIPTGTTGQVLQATTNAPPAFSTATYLATATGTGTILRADGTGCVFSTRLSKSFSEDGIGS